MLTRVTSDLFGIASQLKQIDNRYVVFYNNLKERFEVHTNALEFVVPFQILDYRTIEHAYRTRIHNKSELENQIDEHNRLVEQQASIKMQSSVNQLHDMLNFAHQTSRDVAFVKPKKWI